MRLNKDLIKYLDNLILNYKVIITDSEKILYNNCSEKTQPISKDLKDFICTLNKDTEIIQYFKTYRKIERENLVRSEEKIRGICNNSSNKEENEHYSNKLILTEDQRVVIADNSTLNNYVFECIMPLNIKGFKGSLIILNNDTLINNAIKDSFFRFCKGLFCIVAYFFNNNSLTNKKEKKYGLYSA